jgi:hypothetical protein
LLDQVLVTVTPKLSIDVALMRNGTALGMS